MLEKPALTDSEIAACLAAEYGLKVTQLTFLPLGADRNTAVYRATTGSGADYFIKLRSGDFNALTIALPRLLHDQGCRQIIAPVLTLTQRLWTTLQEYTLAVFPFITGEDGFARPLSAEHWRELGSVLKQIHTVNLPLEWQAQLPHETFSDHWRDQVVEYQTMVEKTELHDSIAAELAMLLRRQRPVIDKLVAGARQFAAILKGQSKAPLEHVLCHGDIHGANLLLTQEGSLYIVDWDTLILAPKERDLMFIGSGLFANYRSRQEEEALFYHGYGATEVDRVALTYYRYERIVQDIAVYCDQIFGSEGSGEDRVEGLRQLAQQFRPGGVIDITLQ
jgi:spectinomycin phosphotransferase